MKWDVGESFEYALGDSLIPVVRWQEKIRETKILLEILLSLRSIREI